jgi:3-oxoacyl-[acyl-carrier-protein] synthase II
MFVVEDADFAAARGAKPLAEIAGYASTCDAYHRVQIAPDVEEPVRAIELALADAGISAADLAYVNLHGTGTLLNDRLETIAMHKALGDRADKIPMSSTKSMVGHPQGACGAAGIAATILCARHGKLHPTINLRERDPDCDLDYATEPRPLRGEFSLCNCIAFGSKNSALVIRHL